MTGPGKGGGPCCSVVRRRLPAQPHCAAPTELLDATTSRNCTELLNKVTTKLRRAHSLLLDNEQRSRTVPHSQSC